MVQVELDKTRELKFDLRAIKDLESAMGGVPLGTIVNQLSMVGVTAITTALWAGLKHEDKALTINLTTKYLQTYIDSGKSLHKLARALNQAIDDTGLFTRSDEEEPEGNALTAT